MLQWGPDLAPPSAIEICECQRLISPKASFHFHKSSFSPHSVKRPIRALEAVTVELRGQYFCRTDHMGTPSLCRGHSKPFKQTSHMVGAQTFIWRPVGSWSPRACTCSSAAGLAVLGCLAVRKTECRSRKCVASLRHRCPLTSNKRTYQPLTRDNTLPSAICVDNKLFHSRRANGLLQAHGRE